MWRRGGTVIYCLHTESSSLFCVCQSPSNKIADLIPFLRFLPPLFVLSRNGIRSQTLAKPKNLIAAVL